MRGREVLRALVVAALWVGGLALGFAGEHAYRGGGWTDVLYRDLQLFVLGFNPADPPRSLPVTLDVARFVAPAATALTAAEALGALLSEQLQRWSTTLSRGHAVVTGDGPAASQLARRLAGRHVVLVTTEPVRAEQAREDGLRAVVGAADEPAVLRNAGVGRAAVLYACTDSDAVNAATVLRARDLSAGRELTAYAQVGDPNIAAALRARRIGTGRDPGFRLDFFALDQIAARRLLDSHPLPAPIAGTVLTLVGFGGLGRSVLREVARRRPPGDPRVAVTVVHGGPAAEVHAVLDAIPAIGVNCAVTVAAAAAGPSPLTLVCLPDPDEGLRAGFDRSVLPGGGQVVVCLPVPSPFGPLLAGPGAMLDDVRGRLSVFGVVEEACVPELIDADTRERIARAIHDSYVAGCAARGDTRATNPSMVAWDELPERLRAANRGQAADLGAKLELIGATAAPESAALPDFAFTDAEVERLAPLEHARWVNERTAAGLEYGPVRDATHHPDLVDWDRLGEPARDKDRQAIRDIPGVLREAGFQVLRLGLG